MKNKFATLLLGVTTVAVTLTLGKSIVHPEVISAQYNDYQFTETIPLSQWKLSSSKPINSSLARSVSGEFISGKHYRYQQDKRYLDIEMRYVVDTDGDLKTFITDRTSELSPGLRNNSDRGFYSVYVDPDKAYLTACINPRGGSTVTSDRFRRNRTIYDNDLQRVISWLVGKTELRDKRCLWAHLAITLDESVSVEEHYRLLETAWFDWYDYWRSRYPEA